MREGGLRQSVMLCGRGLRATHMHRPITTYFLGAKLGIISLRSKFLDEYFQKCGKSVFNFRFFL